MNLLSSFSTMLDLTDSWTLMGVDIDPTSESVVVTIESSNKLLVDLVCPHCSSNSLRIYDRTKKRCWNHLKLWRYSSFIHCRPPRILCKNCSRVSTVTPPWQGKNKHLTKDFEVLALSLMRHMPVTKTGELLGVDDQKLWRMLGRHVDDAREDLDWSDVTRIGVDELSSAKGHKYLSVFVNMETKSVLFAAEGKSSRTFEEFTDELYLHNGHPHAITEISMDMGLPYQKGAQENMRNATVVFDHFHVIQKVTKAIHAVCSRERKKKEISEVS